MNFTKLDAYLSEMEARGIPACDTMVMVDGKMVYRHMEGYADLERKRPVSDTDTYYLYSCTKIMTCTAAAQLVEQGLLSLDDPLEKYLPAFANMQVAVKGEEPVPAESPILIRHLFCMSAGLNYWFQRPEIYEAMENGVNDTVGLVSVLAQRPLDFHPGTHYCYSLCHDVLGAVVEVVSGEHFRDYCRRHIMEPLGMTDTTFHATEDQTARLSQAYRFMPGEFRSESIPAFNGYEFTPEYDSGGAGLCSSAASYAKLPAALANGGVGANGNRILKEETVMMLTESLLTPSALADFGRDRFAGYGFGMCGRTHMRPEVSGGLSPAGEFGWDGAAASYVMIDPFNRVAVFFCTFVHNCGYAYNFIHPRLRDLTYQCLSEE